MKERGREKREESKRVRVKERERRKGVGKSVRLRKKRRVREGKSECVCERDRVKKTEFFRERPKFWPKRVKTCLRPFALCSFNRARAGFFVQENCPIVYNRATERIRSNSNGLPLFHSLG